MLIERASTIYDQMYLQRKRGVYSQSDFENDWPQLLELARQSQDWELLQGVRLMLPKEWWEEKYMQAVKESWEQVLTPAKNSV